MSLAITPGTNNVGAYINNVDLTNLNNNQATEIKKTLDKFGVIFIKNQKIYPKFMILCIFHSFDEKSYPNIPKKLPRLL